MLPQTQIKEIGIGTDLRLRFDEDCTSLDASKRGLFPDEMLLMAYWLRSPKLIAAINFLDVSGNFIFRSKDTNPGNYGNKTVHGVGVDQTGFATI